MSDFPFFNFLIKFNTKFSFTYIFPNKCSEKCRFCYISENWFVVIIAEIIKANDFAIIMANHTAALKYLRKM